MPPKAVRQRRRPIQERSRATREHILDTAGRLFGERGIADTSTNRIAMEAEVSIGTVYRYFDDKSVMVDELLERLLSRVEERFTRWLSGLPQQSNPQSPANRARVVTELLEVFTDELVASAKLVRALVGGVQFYNSGLPEFEPRLRLLVKLLLIQIIGPGDDHKYDVMAFVLVNTGFAAVLRASALEVDSRERQEVVAMTGYMIAAWIEAEIAADRLPAPQ
ncbi:TetR/AcrR family transcriptional regulator [Nocardia acidivorans]|uniref:TetR/AcrR family transcriptional regulator n=1 Tax=Nocardia acidivorans TaxID=404580 RepID=UPI0008324A79|nr:TetR/AcrR family transcriptional regulator [Nocardia acidivorans]